MAKKKSRQTAERSRRRGSELMQQQRARERRRSALVQAGVVLAVVVAVVLVTVAVLRSQEAGEPATAPAAVDDAGSFLVGDPDAPVNVTVVEDFLCPFCQQLEAEAGGLLTEYSAGSEVSVSYRGVAILDRPTNDDYSSRALNASACVMGQGEDVWTEFHRTLYEQQPSESGAGLTDDELVALATESGAAEDEVSDCVVEGTYLDWAEQVTRSTVDTGISSTPTVLVDGDEVDELSATTIQAAVDSALAAGS